MIWVRSRDVAVVFLEQPPVVSERQRWNDSILGTLLASLLRTETDADHLSCQDGNHQMQQSCPGSALARRG